MDRPGPRAGLPRRRSSPRWCSPATRRRTSSCASSFVQASLDALEALAARLADEGAGDLAVVVGYCGRTEQPAPALGRPAGEPQNSAAVLSGGRVVARYAKHHLPNYGVFDEFRYFVRGDRLPVVRVHGVDVALSICEDLWQEGGPVRVAREAGAGLLLCLNGSPYERGKDDVRGELVARRAQEAGCALAYVNMVGGQDELVFDGDSLVVDAAGTVVARAPLWEEGLMCVDLDLPAATLRRPGPVDAGDGTTMTVEHVVLTEQPLPPYDPLVPGIAAPLDDMAELWGALVTATRDYVEKNRFRSASCSACPAASTAPWSRRSPATPSARSGCTSSACRATGAPPTRSPTPRTWRAGRACSGSWCRSSRWSTRTCRRSSCRACRWRTCRPACAGRCSWRCPTSTATWC